MNPKAWRWTIALCALAAVWLWFSTSPPPMEGHARQFFGAWRTRNFGVALFLVWLAVLAPFALGSRRAWMRFVLVHAVVAAAWILLEIAGILGIVAWHDMFAGRGLEQMGTRAVPEVDESGVTFEDLSRSWGFTSPPIPFHFRTDRHGFRNEPDRESADVYLLGDSFLVAGLLPHEKILSAALEGRLSRPVMNVALIGLSPQAERDLLLASGVPLDGRLVLQFVFEGNDLLDSAAYRGLRKPEEEKEPAMLERTLLNSLVVRLQLLTQPHPAYAARRTGRIGDREYRFGWIRSSFDGWEGEMQPIADVLAELAANVRGAGGTYAVVLIPSKLRVLGPYCTWPEGSELSDYARHCSPLPEFLRTWSGRSGIPFLDLTPALSAAVREKTVPWFEGDTHWNEIGHRVAAEAIAAWPIVEEWARTAPRR